MGFFFNRGVKDQSDNKGAPSDSSFKHVNNKNDYYAGKAAQQQRELEQRKQQEKKK